MAIGVLERRLAALADAAPFALYYQVRPLVPAPGGTPRISRGADVVVPSFSTRKVGVLCATLALARAGRLSLDERVTVTEELKDGVQAGVLRNLAAGIELSLRDCLVQMMATSDNICTQLVFSALGAAVDPVLPGTAAEDAALQYVNDYCAWAGMRATWHRETFPRTGELTWSHPLDTMTVTTAVDQCHLLARLARGTTDEDAAGRLQLTGEDCRYAVELMRGIYTPRLGAATDRVRFAEKNGRGLRSLSQVGIALDARQATPLAAVAVYAETIPTRLPDGLPGRTAVFEAFAAVGLAVQDAVAPQLYA